MKEENIKFYETIESYLGNATKNINNIERQKDAVIKMSFLKGNEFTDLLKDVCDEISRRKLRNSSFLCSENKFPDKRNASRKKLSRLDDVKFKNLLLDIYLVYNHRFKSLEKKNTEDIENLIGEFEALKKQLKGELEYEQMIIKTISEEQDVRLKMHVYNKYVKRILDKHNEDLAVVNYVEKILTEVFNSAKISIEELLTPVNFVKISEKFFQENQICVEEYEYHKKNIENILQDISLDENLKTKLLGKEIINIMEIIQFSMNLDDKTTVQSIESEITTIIKNLEAIKVVIQEDKPIDEYYKIGNSVLEVTDTLSDKLCDFESINQELKDKFSNEKNDLRNYIEAQKFDLIPDIIFNMANIVKTILYCIPVSDLR